ncbi:MAG TPA: hypothetical protein VGO68_18015 [Pyrinomonadaceae bacterium]|jgi:hypothetical protein|nr:hypothetical protein [Pyrinomonadaceae bacterium]
MRRALALVLFMVVAAALSPGTAAQDSNSAAATESTIETLRVQLLDAQNREAELQVREQQLNEAVKPENIERSLAGVGSTRPEELRETRRRQLTIERDGVRAQLKLVATSRERLESVIRTAETQAYQQSAAGGSPLLNHATAGKRWSLVWLIGTVALVGEILGIVVLVTVARKRLRTVN